MCRQTSVLYSEETLCNGLLLAPITKHKNKLKVLVVPKDLEPKIDNRAKKYDKRSITWSFLKTKQSCEVT